MAMYSVNGYAAWVNGIGGVGCVWGSMYVMSVSVEGRAGVEVGVE